LDTWLLNDMNSAPSEGSRPSMSDPSVPQVSSSHKASPLLDLLDRPIAFHRIFVSLTGSVAAGLMLSQAFYWARRTKDPAGWFWKTQAEWEEETGLKRLEQERVRARLRTCAFWKEERRGIPAKMYFRLDLKVLEAALLGAPQPPCTVETVMKNDAPYLRSLAKTAYMRCRKAGIEAEHVNYIVVLRTKGMTCGICGQPITRPPGQRPGALSFDHIVPLNAGGTC
jgi:hypothetical protein